MKPSIILSSALQRKWGAKFSIAIVLLLEIASCEKEGVSPHKSVPLQALVFKNLSWAQSAPDSGFRLQVTTLSEKYLLDRLQGVYINDQRTCWSASSGFKHCMDVDDIGLLKLKKDGDVSGVIYYEIVNRTIFLYVKRTSDPYFHHIHQDVVVRWK